MRGWSSAMTVADLHLHDRVAAVEIAAHLGAQLLDALARIVVAARRVDEHARLRRALVPLGEQAEQRLAGDLRHRVPHRHVDGADRDRALAVPARLLVLHQRRPDAVGIEIVARVVEQRFRLGLEQPRREPLADQPALAVAAVRVEAVADDRLAVALDVGDQRHMRQRHLREVDVRIGDRRGDRHRLLADVDDAHVIPLGQAARRRRSLPRSSGEGRGGGLRRVIARR